MKYKYLYFLISLFFLVPSIFSLLFWGLKLSIDFTGGSVLEIRIKNLPSQSVGSTSEVVSRLRRTSEVEGVDNLSVQTSGKDTYFLKMKEIDNAKKEQLLTTLKSEFDTVEEVRFESVGPIIGQELIRKTIVGIILAAGFILLYVARSFKEKMFGICAILAMFHDSLILLGAFSLLGHFFGVEVDTLFVTAILTILSFSVHDTVVVYDRIRESIRLYSKTKFEDLVNKAVAETLTRSVNNSMTIIFMLLCLFLLGGQTIHWFALALLVGTISGTYSSTFSAVPLLVVWEEWQLKHKKK